MIVKGFINIQKSDNGFYTGADIHETEEAAKLNASKNTVGSVYIAMEPKELRTYVKKQVEEEREEVGIRSKRRGRPIKAED